MPNDLIEKLTEKEILCLKLASEGLSAKESAQYMGISERTVRFHLTNVREKLCVDKTVQAVALYGSVFKE